MNHEFCRGTGRVVTLHLDPLEAGWKEETGNGNRGIRSSRGGCQGIRRKGSLEFQRACSYGAVILRAERAEKQCQLYRQTAAADHMAEIQQGHMTERSHTCISPVYQHVAAQTLQWDQRRSARTKGSQTKRAGISSLGNDKLEVTHVTCYRACVQGV